MHIEGMTGTAPELLTSSIAWRSTRVTVAHEARSTGSPFSSDNCIRSPNRTFFVRKFNGRAWPPSSSIRRARYSLTSPASTRSTMASVSASV